MVSSDPPMFPDLSLFRYSCHNRDLTKYKRNKIFIYCFFFGSKRFAAVESNQGKLRPWRKRLSSLEKRPDMNMTPAR